MAFADILRILALVLAALCLVSLVRILWWRRGGRHHPDQQYVVQLTMITGLMGFMMIVVAGEYTSFEEPLGWLDVLVLIPTALVTWGIGMQLEPKFFGHPVTRATIAMVDAVTSDAPSQEPK